MFLNAIMLAGLAGAAAPLILHLLAKARYRNVDWGAMMFLAQSNRRQQRRGRLKQWALLALRMSIIALLALAMARPLVGGLFRSLAPGAHADIILIFDCSASMAVEEAGHSRIDLARRAAIAVISQLQRGDRVAIVTGGLTQTPPTLSSDLQRVADTLASLNAGENRLDIGLAIWQAANALETGQSPNREIYIISDRQSTSWTGIDESFAAGMNRRFAAWSRPPRICYLPVGSLQHDNLAIESFTATSLPALAKQPVELEIRLRNFTDATVSDIPLTITDGPRELYRTTALLPPNSALVLRSTVQFDQVGCPVLTAQIKPDSLPFDDRRDLSILLNPPLQVLIISGDERQSPFGKESDFLRLALSPFSTSGEPGQDPVRTTVITPAKWQRPDPRKFPVVILANVPTLSDSQAADLEQFVYSGGGLLISSGSLLLSDSYNATLFRDGAGILPAKLGDSLSARATLPTSIIGVDVAHPLFRFLRGRPDPVPSVTISRHTPVQTTRAQSKTLATLATGEPLLLERPAGKGTVLLLTTTLDADWSNLPLSSFYLPTLQSAVRYLASRQLPEMNIPAGQPISLNVDGIAEDAPPKLTRPDAQLDPMELFPSLLSSELRYDNTTQPGRYQLKLKTPTDQRAWTFISQPPSEESDLTPLSSDRLSQLRTLLDMQVVEPRPDQLTATVGAGRIGQEIWLPLTLLTLLLLALELTLSHHLSSQSPPRTA